MEPRSRTSLKAKWKAKITRPTQTNMDRLHERMDYIIKIKTYAVLKNWQKMENVEMTIQLLCSIRKHKKMR